MIEGVCREDFLPVKKAMARQLQGGGGAAVAIYYQGETVVDLWGGTGWSKDTVCLAVSTNNGLLTTLVHTLVHRGLIGYDVPVAHYWPELGCAGKERITVRDVLCHRAGLQGVRGLIDHAEQMLDWEHMI